MEKHEVGMVQMSVLRYLLQHSIIDVAWTLQSATGSTL
jgi:hypothetical protein